MLISHDLGVIAQNVARMLVMYGGSVVESGPTDSVFANRIHPYSLGLFAARPGLRSKKGQRLATIPGTVPELVDLPPGCPFAGRCGFTIPDCHVTVPPPYRRWSPAIRRAASGWMRSRPKAARPSPSGREEHAHERPLAAGRQPGARVHDAAREAVRPAAARCMR